MIYTKPTDKKPFEKTKLKFETSWYIVRNFQAASKNQGSYKTINCYIIKNNDDGKYPDVEKIKQMLKDAKIEIEENIVSQIGIYGKTESFENGSKGYIIIPNTTENKEKLEKIIKEHNEMVNQNIKKEEEMKKDENINKPKIVFASLDDQVGEIPQKASLDDQVGEIPQKEFEDRKLIFETTSYTETNYKKRKLDFTDPSNLKYSYLEEEITVYVIKYENGDIPDAKKVKEFLRNAGISIPRNITLEINIGGVNALKNGTHETNGLVYIENRLHDDKEKLQKAIKEHNQKIDDQIEQDELRNTAIFYKSFSFDGESQIKPNEEDINEKAIHSEIQSNKEEEKYIKESAPIEKEEEKYIKESAPIEKEEEKISTLKERENNNNKVQNPYDAPFEVFKLEPAANPLEENEREIRRKVMSGKRTLSLWNQIKLACGCSLSVD